jgi:hypothetical protein
MPMIYKAMPCGSCGGVFPWQEDGSPPPSRCGRCEKDAKAKTYARPRWLDVLVRRLADDPDMPIFTPQINTDPAPPIDGQIKWRMFDPEGGQPKADPNAEPVATCKDHPGDYMPGCNHCDYDLAAYRNWKRRQNA